jgi:hypothetical protein
MGSECFVGMVYSSCFLLPELTVVPAMGLSIVISYLTYHNSKQNDYAIWHVFIRPFGALFIGWIFHFFM